MSIEWGGGKEGELWCERVGSIFADKIPCRERPALLQEEKTKEVE